MRKTYDLVTSKEGFADNYGNVLKVAKIKLSGSQVKLLRTFPITLIPAPGAGKFIVVYHITAYLDYATAVFTGGNNIEIRENNATGTKVTPDITSVFLNSGADILVSLFAEGSQTTRLLNKPIIVAVPVANPGGVTAASTLTLIVSYMVVKVF